MDLAKLSKYKILALPITFKTKVLGCKYLIYRQI